MPSGIVFLLPLASPASLAAGAAADLGIKSAGFVLIPSLPGSTTAVAISCAVALAFIILSVNACTTIGKFIPATIAHLSCFSARPFAWLKGVPPHKSTKNKTSSWLSNEAIAFSILPRISSGPSLGFKITCAKLSCSPKSICADCAIPSAKPPWLAKTIPTM